MSNATEFRRSSRATQVALGSLILLVPFANISFLNVGGRGFLRPDWLAVALLASFVAWDFFALRRTIHIFLPLLPFVVLTSLSAVNFVRVETPPPIAGFTTTMLQAGLAFAAFVGISSVRLGTTGAARVLALWWVSAAVHSAYAIYQPFARALDLPFAWPVILNPSYGGYGHATRTREMVEAFFIPSGVFNEPSFLAQYLLPPFAALLVLVALKRPIPGLSRRLAKACLAVMAGALLLTTRLTAYLGVIAVTALLLLDGGVITRDRRSLRAAMGFAVRLALVVTLFSVLGDLVFGYDLLGAAGRRVGQFGIYIGESIGIQGDNLLAGHQESLSVDTRWSRLTEGLAVWIQQPVFGIGLNGLDVWGETDRVHNSFGQLLIEQGIFGFLAYGGLFVATWIRTRMVGASLREPNSFNLAGSYAIMALAMMAFVGGTWFKLYWWFVLGISYLCSREGSQTTVEDRAFIQG